MLALANLVDIWQSAYGIPLYSFAPFGVLALTVCLALALAEVQARARQELQEKTRQLAHAEKLVSLGTLVAGVAHEINNPNNAIRLNATTLEKMWQGLEPVLDEYAEEHGDFTVGGLTHRELKEEVASALQRTTRNSERIHKIVEGLRVFARKDEGSYEERIDCNAIVTEAISVLEGTIRRSTRNFRLELGEGLPALKGNVQRLEQVVINLVNNARQALTADTQGIAVSTAYDADSKNVLIVVRDEGKGMDAKTLVRTSEAFFTTKGPDEGTGLGLSICRGIVERHGGRLDIESEKGLGTTARIVLPVSADPRGGAPHQASAPSRRPAG
jgi:polar amino acid transport system substrate-binding protein